MPRWSEEEFEKLKSMYTDTPNEVIANELGRTLSSVKSKAYVEGLEKNPLLSRTYRCRVDDIEYPSEDTEFAHWLCGFVDGEGCFSITEYNGRTQFKFQIGLASSDDSILKEIKEFFGVGEIYYYNPEKDEWEENANYAVSNANDLALTIIPFFDEFGLRAENKQNQFNEFRDRFVEHYNLNERLK